VIVSAAAIDGRTPSRTLTMMMRARPRDLVRLHFAMSLALAMFPAIACAQVGQRNFYSALITEGTDPSNDLTLSPGWVTVAGQTQAAYSFTLEKQITDNSSILLGNALGDAARRRLQVSSGADDMEILGKWAFYMNAKHEFRTGIALDVLAPTGDIEAGAGGHWRGGPMILAEKGAGDLPDRGVFHYLRPFAVQMDAEYLPRWTGSQLDLVAFDAALSYQLDYLSGPGSDFGADSPFRQLVFFNEFNYQQMAWGFQATGTTPPDWRVTPGIAYATTDYQLAAGTQLGLSKLGSRACHSSGLFQIDIYFDQIFPQLGARF
jgi:hypothetical protein